MRYLRQYRYVLLFLATLVFCSVMVVRQWEAKKQRHVELREAFVLLYTRGYRQPAEKVYNSLVRNVYKEDTDTLLDDFQRTLLLVDPTTDQPQNLIWKYHWTISNELEKRSESTIKRALRLADEEK